jgi:hypothetical protein
MDFSHAQLHALVGALETALGEDLDLATVVSDLAHTGAEGKAIRRGLRPSGNTYQDCRSLILACTEYPNGVKCLRDCLHPYLHLKAAWAPLNLALVPFLPAKQSVAASSTGLVSQNVYISYAWKDSSPEGKRRGQLVDDLCQALTASGIKFMIDREQVNPGQRISSFMKAITKGDMIVVVLSNRYLESEFCMYELNGIWKHSGEDADLFLSRVIPLILPDVKLKTTKDFLARGEYWLSQKRDLDAPISANLDAVSPPLFDRYDLIRQFAANVTKILLLLLDKYEPRNFDDQAQTGFHEVVAQILSARSN